MTNMVSSCPVPHARRELWRVVPGRLNRCVSQRARGGLWENAPLPHLTADRCANDALNVPTCPVLHPDPPSRITHQSIDS